MRTPSLPPSSRYPFLPVLLLAGLLLAAAIPRSAGFALLDYYLPDGNFPMQLQLQTGGPSGQNWNQIAQEGLQQWNQYLTGTKFTWVANSTSAKGEYNRKNDVFWSGTVYSEPFPEGVLAVTLIWTTESDDSTIAETDTIFNSGFSGGWDSYRGALRYKGRNVTIDFRRVAIHEFGHTLGLDHPDEHGDYSAVAVMRSQISGTDDLTNDDIAGATYLFGPKVPPKITQQPQDVTTSYTWSIHFQGRGAGRGPLWAYWEKDGVQLQNPMAIDLSMPGSTVSYNTDPYQTNQTYPGGYTLVIGNPYGKVRSRTAKLTISPCITKPVADQSVLQGGTATFSVSFSGATVTGYQWSHDGVPIAGATKATLKLPNVQPADAGAYSVVVSTAAGSFSAGGKLALKLGAEISPAQTVGSTGGTAVLSSMVSGVPLFMSLGELAIDGKGNLYVSDNSVRKISTSGVVTTLNDQKIGRAIACDTAGGVYFSNESRTNILQLATNGSVSLLAGGRDDSVDGRVTRAAFNSIYSLARDSDGSLYIAARYAIRKLSTSGLVTTIAGSATNDTRRDGTGTAAGFTLPYSIAVGPNGTLYVLDRNSMWQGGHVIRKVSPAGVVTTLAGGPSTNGQAVDGKGAAAVFANPHSIAVDRSGNIYVTDVGAVRKITATGVVTTLAGNLKQIGYRDGAGKEALFSSDLEGIAVAADGTVYVADTDNNVIRKITKSGIVSTYAGIASTWGLVDGSRVTSYQWKQNGKAIAGATQPTLTLSNLQKGSIGTYTLTVTNAAGTITSAPASVDIQPTFTTVSAAQIKMAGTSATLTTKLSNPSGRPLTYQWYRNYNVISGATSATLTLKNLQTTDEGTYFVIVSDGKYSVPSPNIVVQIALTITAQPQGITAPDGTIVPLTIGSADALEPLFSWPSACIADAKGNIFVVNSMRVIRKISTAGVVTTLAGRALDYDRSLDGTGTAARFASLQALAKDSSDNLYALDANGVRKITPAGVVTTLAGNVDSYGDYVDGTGAAARFDRPTAIAVDRKGNLYVSESIWNGRIRKVTPAGVVTTFVQGFSRTPITTLAVNAADTLFAFANDGTLYKIDSNGKVTLYVGRSTNYISRDGSLTEASLGVVAAAGFDASGNLYAAEYYGGIRKITPAGIVSTPFPRSSDGIQNWQTPSGFCLDGMGGFIVVEGESQTIRKIGANALIFLLAGRPWTSGIQDGTITRYQWQRNGTNIPGATGSQFVIENLQTATAGNYTVVVTNSIGSLTSEVATVVNQAAAPWDIVFDASTRAVAPAGTLTLSVAARGTEPLTYQWLKDGAIIPGATGIQLKLSKMSAADRGYYAVRIGNDVGTVTTTNAGVNVTSVASAGLPAVATNIGGVEASRRIGSGYDLTFSASIPAAIAAPLQYQWMKDGVAVAGATRETLAFTHLRSTDSGMYTVQVSSATGVFLSQGCALLVPEPIRPAINWPPWPQSNAAGEAVSFHIAMANDEALETFQWLKNGIPISGATSSSLTLSPIGPTDEADYSVIVTNDAGSVASPAAHLTVTPAAPKIAGPVWLDLQEDTWSAALPFTITDWDTPVSALKLSVTSSSPDVIPLANIVIGGSGSNRTLKVKGALDQNGSSVICLTVSDGVRTTTGYLQVTVTPVNDRPVIGAIDSRTIKANTFPPVIPLEITDVDSAWGLYVTATSSNQLLLPNSSFEVYQDLSRFTLHLTPAANQTGTAIVTVTVSDGELSASRKFSVTVTNSNRAPTISALADQTVNEDTATAALPFTIGDPDTSASYLNLSVKSSNTKLVPVANVVFGGSAANRTVKLTPAANQSGTAKITVTVSDGALSASRTFTLTVKPVNDAPTISALADQTVNEDMATAALPFTVGDPETAAASLKVTTASSNPTLLPAGKIVLGGSGANRTVKLTPAANQSGTAKITVTVSDGALSASRTFTLTVKPINDAPTISALADQTVNEDTATAVLPFTVGDVEIAADSLKVTAATSNSTLLPVGSIVLGGSGANRTVKLTPAANQNGTAIVTLTVSDGQLSAARLFKLTVQAVNDTPTISAIADQTVPESSSPQVISFTIADAESAPDFLTVSAASSNDAVLPTAGIAFGGSGANRTLTLTPAASQIGSSTVSLTVSDGSLTATRSFTFTVAPLPLVTLSAPARQVVAPGAAFSFGVSATGTGAFSYQWWHNGRAIAGATSATFNGLAAAAGDAGYYWVDVTDSVGTRRSATVFVLLAPSATTIAGWGDDSLQQTEPPAATTPFVALAASSGHALALSADGTVAAWGSSHPLVPADLTEVVAVAAGQSFAVALRADGSAVSWGDLAGAFAGVPLVAISSGPSHVLGVTRDGTVAGAGLATSGQLTIPAGLDHVTAVAAGATHSLALTSDGSVVAWGGNAAGQATVPAGLADVVAIAAGDDFSLALKSDGTVAAWGGNDSHQTDVPAGLANVIAIGAGTDHALALTSDGSVVAWGDSLSGQITVPAGLDRVVAIAAGDAFSLALRDAAPDAAPAFTTQPADQAVLAGGAVDFVVIASGHPGIAFQWQQSTDGGTTWTNLTDGPAISGAQTSVLTLGAVDLAMSGRQFRCVASNSVASGVASAAATLVVNAP